MSSLKNLNINKPKFDSEIETSVKSFFGNNATLKIDENGSLRNFTISVSGTDYKFSYSLKSDGTTSIWAIGNPETHSKTDMFLKKISTDFSVLEKKSISFSVKDLSDENIENLYTYLEKECSAIKTEDKNDKVSRIIKYKSFQRDTLTIKRYNNGNTQFQGKPLYLYSKVCDFLSNFCSAKDIIEAQKQCYNIELNEDYINNQYEARFSKSHTYLEGTLKNILLPAFSLTTIEINNDLTDYSFFVFPVLKGLEGYIRKILSDNEIRTDNNYHPIGSIFAQNKDNWVVKTEYRSKMSQETISALGKLYSYWASERNPLFHVDGNINATRLVETRKEADDIFNTVVDLIESTYIDITK